MESGYISGTPRVKENKEHNKPKGITIKKVENGLKSIDVIHLIEALEGIKLDFDHLYYYKMARISSKKWNTCKPVPGYSLFYKRKNA